MSYRLVEDLQKKACPRVAVNQACRLLEVSRSGYYANAAAHKQRLGTPVVCAASVHLKAAFAASQKAYGSRTDCVRPWLSVASPWADTECAL